FPHQGWVRNNGLTVVAPGLPEAEVDDDGTIYITALRAVGSLSRVDLRGRPQPAGPGLRTPEAQCRGTMAAQLALAFGSEPSREALNAELGLRAVPAGPNPIVPEGSSLMMLEGEGVVLSAVKPAQDERRLVVRVLNPTDDIEDVTLRFAPSVDAAISVRLDEEPDSQAVTQDGNTVGGTVGPHALRSWRIELSAPGT
ncbi:MAG: hypothetical protein JO050_07605, partial [Acidimicrobiia bacterium]|nr:hypothetical protein [Acidimicrobiia bacterium]